MDEVKKTETQSLQERYASKSICFGCGPANAKGLRIRSFPHGDEVVADWMPESHHEAYPGMLNGGIVGSLLDCHSNWAAAWRLMNDHGWDKPQCTVTAKYSVQLLAPTPSNQSLHLRARIVDVTGGHVTVESELSSNGKVTAKCKGVFVMVKPGHPAHHRWD